MTEDNMRVRLDEERQHTDNWYRRYLDEGIELAELRKRCGKLAVRFREAVNLNDTTFLHRIHLLAKDLDDMAKGDAS